MRILLALVLSAVTTGACAAPQATPYSLSDLFREACIDTGLDRSALAVLAAAKGWQEIPFEAGIAGPQWGVGYYLGYARVMVIGYDRATDRDAALPDGLAGLPAHITCEVDFRDAPLGWQEQAAEVAGSLGFSAISLPSEPDDPRETRHWVRGKEAKITSRHDPSTGIVSLSLMQFTGPEASRIQAHPTGGR